MHIWSEGEVRESVLKDNKWCGRDVMLWVRFLMEEPEAPKYKQV